MCRVNVWGVSVRADTSVGSASVETAAPRGWPALFRLFLCASSVSAAIPVSSLLRSSLYNFVVADVDQVKYRPRLITLRDTLCWLG